VGLWPQVEILIWESLEEREVEEGVHGCVVGSQTVLVVAVVDGNLDTDRGIDQTNDGCGDTDIVGGPAVGCASKSKASS
jgi:hypothetical protein